MLVFLFHQEFCVLFFSESDSLNNLYREFFKHFNRSSVITYFSSVQGQFKLGKPGTLGSIKSWCWKNVVSVGWGPRKKAANILAGEKIMKVEKILIHWRVTWKKNDRRRPRTVRVKTDSCKQLYVITFFPSNFLPSTPGLGLMKREFKTYRT